MRPFAEAFQPELLTAARPAVDVWREIPKYRHVIATFAGNLLNVLDDGESPSCFPR